MRAVTSQQCQSTQRLSSGAGGYVRGRREDSTTMLTEEMQKQATEESCDIFE
jgi:hypothetical protein